MKKWLECRCCNSKYDIEDKYLVCPKCASEGKNFELTACYDYQNINAGERENILSPQRSIWGYRALLPVADDVEEVSLGEGGTPMTEVLAVKKLGFKNVWCKNESVNPTWSHKDRLNSILATKAKAMGCTDITCSSTGNHGLSAAAYAARAGCKSIIFFAPETPKLMIDLSSSYGALSIVTQWHFRDEMVKYLCGRGFYPFTSPKNTPFSNPFGGEGYKTISYEIVSDLGEAPDKVLIPVAGGALLFGIYKGFHELKLMELIDKEPVIIACQAKGANVLQKAYEEKRSEVGTLPRAFSLATSTREENADDKALVALYETGGHVEVASDFEIQQAMVMLGREGYCAEAASAIPFACLSKMIDGGRVEKDEKCVCILTSGGVKSPDILADLRAPAVRIEGSIEALEKAIKLYY